MVVGTMIDVFFGIIRLAFSGMEIVGLPYQLISTLHTILVYGTWVVGADIMAIFITMIVGWWSIKLVAGLIIWLWELLPIT